ncbi:AAA family ATPase [Chloroflexota bacterium]
MAVSDVQRLFDSLERLPQPLDCPSFVMVSGLPGTGKSYLCAWLAESLPFVIIETDALCKTLLPTLAYSLQESVRLFRAVHHLIERLLGKGVSTILDATSLSEKHREPLYDIARPGGGEASAGTD